MHRPREDARRIPHGIWDRHLPSELPLRDLLDRHRIKLLRLLVLRVLRVLRLSMNHRLLVIPLISLVDGLLPLHLIRLMESHCMLQHVLLHAVWQLAEFHS